MTISSIICNLNYDPTITAGEFGVVIILLFTLVVVIVYTFATSGLWKQARKQTDLQISPFLNFDIDEKDQFFIKNYGNSPAFNVVVDRFSMVINDGVIEQLNIEEPGAFHVSSAEHTLSQI